MNKRKSIERQRMQFAFDQSKNAKDAKKYEAYVQKVPAFIMTNGLGNTIAYISTQTDANWKKVGQNICNWLLEVENPFKEPLSNKNGDDKIKNLLEVLKENENDTEYKSVTIEVLALFNWLRRFAKTHRKSS